MIKTMTKADERSNITNRVAQSSMITFDLEEYYQLGERATLDLKPFLFQELILREKDFREYIRTHNWEQYRNKYVCVHCSTDAIIPMWAFMVAGSYLHNIAKRIFFGTLTELESHLYHEALAAIDWEQFKDKKVVVKGCGKFPVPHWAYVEASVRLAPIAKLVMFGEACSSVPVFKKSSAASTDQV